MGGGGEKRRVTTALCLLLDDVKNAEGIGKEWMTNCRKDRDGVDKQQRNAINCRDSKQQQQGNK